jgi:D-alanine transaminase
MQTAYFNGEFLPRSDVRLSPDDRGFLFSDGVYEVLRSYGGHLFEAGAHLGRLERSLQAMRIRGLRMSDLAPVFDQLLERNGLSDANALIYLQVTRGVAPRSHRFPDPPVPPTVYAFAWAFAPVHRPEEGGHAITVPDQRWARCDIKTIGLIPNCAANQEAHEAAAVEAIFVRDGVALEGTHSNLFVVSRGRVRTAPLTNYILPGVTRRVVLELCEEAGYEVAEESVFLEELYAADEIFIVGTTAEVTPIVGLDGRTIGTGRPGAFAVDLLQRLRERAEPAI